MNLGIVQRRVNRVGGTERYAWDFVGACIRQGHAVTVYAESADVPSGATWVPVPRVRWWNGLPRAWSRDLRPHDAVLGLSRVGATSVFRAGGGLHRAWTRARGGFVWSDFGEHHAEAIAVRDARTVVANSNAAAAALRARYPSARVAVVRNGVDGERFRPDDSTRDRLRATWRIPELGRAVLFVGNGFVRKGLDVAVQAFDRVCEADDRLIVAGQDRHASEYHRRCAELLGPRLVWVGPSDDTAPLYAATDAVLMPTRYDSASNVVLEALSTGVPVVTSGMDGSAEVVPDPAWVAVDPVDVDGVSSALACALRPEARERSRGSVASWTVDLNAATMIALLSNSQESS